MKDNVVYKFLKGASDFSVKKLSALLPEWKATESRQLVEATSFTPTLPANIDQLPDSIAHYFHETLTLPARQLFVISDAYISWHNTIFKNLHIFRPALPHPSVESIYNDSYLLNQWLAKQAVLPNSGEPVALVHDQWTRGNYYHWMVDSLSRLLPLRQYHPGASLIMPEPVPAYIRTTAGLLGFTRLFSLAEGHVLKVKRLIVPQHATPPGMQNPELLQQIQTTVVRALHPAGILPEPTRRIYVSRARQNSRHLRNEKPVVALLERHGFETVYFEDYSFEQQVAIMLETTVLLGVHGANLTNLLFLQPGSTVVELMNIEKFITLENKDFENLIYFRMCSCLQLSYYAVPCKNTADQPPSNYSDIKVDLNELESIIARI